MKLHLCAKYKIDMSKLFNTHPLQLHFRIVAHAEFLDGRCIDLILCTNVLFLYRANSSSVNNCKRDSTTCRIARNTLFLIASSFGDTSKK